MGNLVDEIWALFPCLLWRQEGGIGHCCLGFGGSNMEKVGEKGGGGGEGGGGEEERKRGEGEEENGWGNRTRKRYNKSVHFLFCSFFCLSSRFFLLSSLQEAG